MNLVFEVTVGLVFDFVHAVNFLPEPSGSTISTMIEDQIYLTFHTLCVTL